MPNSQWHIRQRDESEVVIAVLEAVQDFLASADVKRLLPKTRAEYEHALSVFAFWCEDHALVQSKRDKSWKAVKSDDTHTPICLHQVNDQVVQCFLGYIAETSRPSKASAESLSGWTYANYVKNIKRFLNWCLEDEQYEKHVQVKQVQKIRKPLVEQTIIEIFTSGELEALFKACQKEESEHLRLRDLAILCVLLDTGIRATELCTLTIGHVGLDSKDAYVRVAGKGGKWGEVGMGEQSRRAVQKYVRQFREPTIEYMYQAQLAKLPARQRQQLLRQLMSQERLFVNRAGKPLTKSGLDQLIARLGEWASVEGTRCSPHTFRHTFAVLFMRNGGDIYTLSKLLRHSSVKVTEIYLRSIRQSEARRGAKSVLDELK